MSKKISIILLIKDALINFPEMHLSLFSNNETNPENTSSKPKVNPINAANTENVVNFIDLLVNKKFSLCARFKLTITGSIISILYENHPFSSVTEPLTSEFS